MWKNPNGYAAYCPYNGPDLVKAGRLVAESETKGQRVTIWSYDIPIGRDRLIGSGPRGARCHDREKGWIRRVVSCPCGGRRRTLLLRSRAARRRRSRCRSRRDS